MYNLEITSHVPFRMTQDALAAFCAQFNLTLVAWEVEPHVLRVQTKEDVNAAMAASIQTAMAEYVMRTIIQVKVIS